MTIFKRIALGISGGLDSAISALLLKKKGYEVIGVFMKNWDTKDEFGFCASEQDAEDAEWLCNQLEIPFHEVNFVREYWNEVFEYLLSEYKNGRTPNPDIYCNSRLKFGHFLKYSQENLEAQAIATGHYARSSFGDYLEHYQPNKGVKLLLSSDHIKDQTFFLSQIPQSALQKTMFPIGSMTKEIVKKIARENGLSRVADRKESMGICFIGKRKFSPFISQYLPDNPGHFVDLETKEKVGLHSGFHHWTLGQHAKIPGFPWKYFTHSKDMESNVIYVVRGSRHPALFSSSAFVHSLKWIHELPDELYLNGHMECQFRFQNTLPLKDCILSLSTENDSSTRDTGFVSISEPMRALTPGQFAALYKGEECLGAAVIEQPGPSSYDLNIDNCRDNFQSKRECQT